MLLAVQRDARQRVAAGRAWRGWDVGGARSAGARLSVAAAPAVAGACLAAAAVGSNEDAAVAAGFCSHHATQ